MSAECDELLKVFFKRNPDAVTTVRKCKECGLFYRPSFGHVCEAGKAEYDEWFPTGLNYLGNVRCECPKCGKVAYFTHFGGDKYCSNCGIRLHDNDLKDYIERCVGVERKDEEEENE